MKFKTYNGEHLSDYTLSIKLDGVQCTHTPDGWFSKTNKPLFNLPINMPHGIFEYFRGNWNNSISDVRTQDLGYTLDKSHLYRLDILDQRLLIPHKDIQAAFDTEVKAGGEGIIITTPDCRYKMKRVDTADVVVTNWIEGTGKYTGKLGALMTAQGKVGTGFTDLDRTNITADVIGQVIEVAYMELTPNNKFRMPRFIRVRHDKS